MRKRSVSTPGVRRPAPTQGRRPSLASGVVWPPSPQAPSPEPSDRPRHHGRWLVVLLRLVLAGAGWYGWHVYGPSGAGEEAQAETAPPPPPSVTVSPPLVDRKSTRLNSSH